MQYGDLSNRASHVIAFRLEDFLLVKEPNNKFLDKVKEVIAGNYSMSELDPQVMGAINHIYRNSDMTTYLIKDRETKLNEYEKELVDRVYYGMIVEVVKPVDITRMLITGEIAYYVDSKPSRMSQVSNDKCITLVELNDIIRRG